WSCCSAAFNAAGGAAPASTKACTRFRLASAVDTSAARRLDASARVRNSPKAAWYIADLLLSSLADPFVLSRSLGPTSVHCHVRCNSLGQSALLPAARPYFTLLLCRRSRFPALSSRFSPGGCRGCRSV